MEPVQDAIKKRISTSSWVGHPKKRKNKHNKDSTKIQYKREKIERKISKLWARPNTYQTYPNTEILD